MGRSGSETLPPPLLFPRLRTMPVNAGNNASDSSDDSTDSGSPLTPLLPPLPRPFPSYLYENEHARLVQDCDANDVSATAGSARTLTEDGRADHPNSACDQTSAAESNSHLSYFHFASGTPTQSPTREHQSHCGSSGQVLQDQATYHVAEQRPTPTDDAERWNTVIETVSGWIGKLDYMRIQRTARSPRSDQSLSAGEHKQFPDTMSDPGYSSATFSQENSIASSDGTFGQRSLGFNSPSAGHRHQPRAAPDQQFGRGNRLPSDECKANFVRPAVAWQTCPQLATSSGDAGCASSHSVTQESPSNPFEAPSGPHNTVYEYIVDTATKTYRKVLMAATRIELVACLTKDADFEFVSSFFVTYRAFLLPGELMELLIARIRWTALHPSDPCCPNIRLRTLSLLRYWLDHYWDVDFAESSTLCADLSTLLHTVTEGLSEPRSSSIAWKCLRKLDERLRTWDKSLASTQPRELMAPRSSSERICDHDGLVGACPEGHVGWSRRLFLRRRRKRSPNPAATSFRSSRELIVEVPPDVIARQLCLIEQSLFADIGWTELLDVQSWRQKIGSREAHAQGVWAVIGRFNATCRWALAQVTMAKGSHEQTQLLEKLIQITRWCRIYHNYSTLLSLLQALQHMGVEHMPASWSHVDKQCILQLQELRNFVSTKHGSRALRDEQMACVQDVAVDGFDASTSSLPWIVTAQELADPPKKYGAVPFLGLFLSDLVLNEEVDWFVDPYGVNDAPAQDALVNFHKARRLATIIKYFRAFQQPPRRYTFQNEPSIWNNLVQLN
ncbi:ras guanine nucleotide exchange factor domain-containing protein [Gaertneriomyces semiglobifer]|nr:ras guanine nucleotide exchange factor domain-containing protein [Gaertneriomyces semiglobifer]